MRAVQYLVLFLGLSMSVVAQQVEELSYDEMVEIEEVHLADRTASGTEQTEGEGTPPTADRPEELEPPE